MNNNFILDFQPLWHCLLPSLVCAWTGSHRNSSRISCFLSTNQKTIDIDNCCLLLLNADLAAAERRQNLRPFLRVQKSCTFPPPTGVPPSFHQSWWSTSHRTTKAVLRLRYSCPNWDLCFPGFHHGLHTDSQKPALTYDKHTKLATISVHPRELELFSLMQCVLP